MSYIDPRGKVLAHLDRVAAWKVGVKAAPVTVEWDLTNVCSLGCQACHFAYTHVAGPWAARDRATPAGYSDTGRLADPALVERGLGEMAAAGVKAIVWSGGGEPTLHPAFRSIVQAAAHAGLEQGLYTLGGHLTDDLVGAVGPCLSWVAISLDAADARTYAAEKAVPASRFMDACDGVRRMASAGPVVGVSFLLHAGNYTHAPRMLALARSLGATYTTFRPTVLTSPDQPSVTTGNATWITVAGPLLRALATEPDVEIDPERFDAYRDWRGHGYAACHGITLVTQVTPDGRVWVCPNRRGVAGSELGDLRAESFQAIWSRHPATFTVDRGCRAMCRLHLVNQTLAQVYRPRAHEAFV